MWTARAAPALAVVAGSLAILAPRVIPAQSLVAHTTLVTQLVQQEDQVTLTGDRLALEKLFLPHRASAIRAYDKTLQRMTSIADWARARRIHCDGVSVTMRIGPINWPSATEVRVHGADEVRYRYHYLTGHRSSAWFGLGVYHWYVLKDVHGRWYIVADTFIEPLNQDTRLKGSTVPAVVHLQREYRRGHGRTRPSIAARPPGCGHSNRYHPQHPDFNWNGGDCTNFISQVLAAGESSESGQWAC